MLLVFIPAVAPLLDIVCVIASKLVLETVTLAVIEPEKVMLCPSLETYTVAEEKLVELRVTTAESSAALNSLSHKDHVPPR
jgi:hypothetical protein